MNEILKLMLATVEDPYKHVAEWKERNKRKVIGLYPMNLPEELVHAAGMLPVTMWRSNEPITLGLPYVATNHCGLARSLVDDAVKGRLKLMDGVIFYDPCLVARGAEFSLRLHNPAPYHKYIHLPVAMTTAARDYGITVLEKLKASLEEFSGQKVSPEALRKSILTYNENRSLLRKLYELRRQKPGLLRASEMVAVVNSSMLMLKEEHSELLKKLLKELETNGSKAGKRVKVVLSGHLCSAPRLDILDLIDDMGAVVVDDDLYTGYRYCANDVEVNGDGIAALVDRFMKRSPPDTTKPDPNFNWAEFLIGVVRRSGAQGVISLMVKFCPPHQEEHPDIKRGLTAADIPELMLQLEQESVSLAPSKTRLEAFIEQIKGGV